MVTSIGKRFNECKERKKVRCSPNCIDNWLNSVLSMFPSPVWIDYRNVRLPSEHSVSVVITPGSDGVIVIFLIRA